MSAYFPASGAVFYYNFIWMRAVNNIFRGVASHAVTDAHISAIPSSDSAFQLKRPSFGPRGDRLSIVPPRRERERERELNIPAFCLLALHSEEGGDAFYLTPSTMRCASNTLGVLDRH